jgi:hypothetical protein
MRRLHLIEIEDQPWCPGPIRDAATDYLRFAERVGDAYGPIVPLLRSALERAGARRVVDLCSGGGGPWPELHPTLAAAGCEVEVCLTDFYPNLAAFERARAASGGRISYVPHPVDATAAPAELEGFRTLFTGFHHFRPEQARAILRDAVEKRRPIAIFEVTERRALSIALLLLLLPITVLLATPFIRPFRASRLFWTYVLPAVPLLVTWDGVVSCLRTYTPEEMRAMTDEIGARDYVWEIGTTPSGKGPTSLTHLVGLPSGKGLA